MSTSPLNPHGALAEPRPLELKVERQAWPPLLWGWSIRLGGGKQAVRTSGPRFRSAHEAWEAGREALRALGGRG